MEISGTRDGHGLVILIDGSDQKKVEWFGSTFRQQAGDARADANRTNTTYTWVYYNDSIKTTRKFLA